MTTFDVDGRATAARYKLALLRLHLREQVLAREEARAPMPARAGQLAALLLRVAPTTVEQASVEVAAVANDADAAGVRHHTETAFEHDQKQDLRR